MTPMTNMKEDADARFRQEFRLGLVVYGGVSLAIYMNGICHEFFNAVRGRGIYKLLKALTDSHINVDIISGTSAGGINGVLLSYALTNSDDQPKGKVVEFADFANIWRDSGSIDRLLRPFETDRPTTEVDSLLDGEGYYQQKLEEALQAAWNNKRRDAALKEWPSRTQELNLFVTGTDLQGRVTKAFDNTGSVIEIKSYATVFLLKHRRDRRREFEPDKDRTKIKALAKMCRITSCFPVAFPAVTVELGSLNTDGSWQDPTDATGRVDRQLMIWGQLGRRELPTHPLANRNGHQSYRLYFVDGGVLDNRPFSYTIREIYNRTTYRPVSRKLFYIDPNCESFTQTRKFEQMARPNILEVVGSSLVGLPTYESIGNDLTAINSYNEKVRRYNYLVEAKLAFPEHYGIDRWAQSANPQGQDGSGSKPLDFQYWWIRLVMLRDRVLPIILRMDDAQTTEVAAERQQKLEQSAALLTSYIDESETLEERENAFRHASVQVCDLDIDYALRKHFFIHQRLCAQLKRVHRQSEMEYLQLSPLAKQITWQIKLLQVIEAALNYTLGQKHISDQFFGLLVNASRQELYSYILLTHYRFLICNDPDHLRSQFDEFFSKVREDSDSKLLSDQLSTLLKNLRQRGDKLDADLPPDDKPIWHAVKNGSRDPMTVQSRLQSLLYIVDQQTEDMIAHSGVDEIEITCSKNVHLLDLFRNFRDLDEDLLPLEYLSDVKEKEQIELVRISPNDAKMGYGAYRKSEDKLASKSLFSFGGFFKRSWRSNDILWGRLDGLDRIVGALINAESLGNFRLFLLRQPQLQNWASDQNGAQDQLEQYLEELVNDAFPNLKSDFQEDWKTLIDKLRELANSDTLPKEHWQQGSTKLKELQELLVRAGHREILYTDLENVFADAAREQLEWNAQRRRSPSQKVPGFEPVGGYFNRTVTAIAAADLARSAMQKYSLKQKEDLFTGNNYTIGTESIDGDIPRQVLFSLGSKAAVILRDVLYSLDAQRVGRSPIYQFYDLSAQWSYLLTRLWAVQLLGASGLRLVLIRGVIRLGLLICALLLLYQFALPSFQKPAWTQLVCGITIFGLFWLSGLYWGRPRRVAEAGYGSKEA